MLRKGPNTLFPLFVIRTPPHLTIDPETGLPSVKCSQSFTSEDVYRCETDRILWALDHLGMHEVARDGMSIWLENQQPDGALSLNSGIETEHKVGALQLLWVMTEHDRLTGDRQWLQEQLPRLKAAADWILNRRRSTMKRDLSPEELAEIKAGTRSPYGLPPRIQMGDGDPQGATYFYMADAAAHRSIQLLAEVAGEVDPKLGAELQAEAERYRRDLVLVVEESLVLSPLIRTRDGTYRSFLPQGFQDRGPRAVALPETVDMNLKNWTFNEPTTFAENDKSHGNSVFLSNFRNMLAMERGDELWLARATPRVWLAQSRKIAVKNAPTHFGTLAYEIVSDVDHGRIAATVELPSRRAPKSVCLRFRRPQAAPIQRVTVNGQDWSNFDKALEIIRLDGLQGQVAVMAQS